MITYDGPGDLFSSSCDALVVPVNCAGVMGKGVALTFQERFPGLLERYRKHFPRTDRPDPALLEHIGVVRLKDGRKIVLLPTKLHWRDTASLSALHLTLQALLRVWETEDLGSVAFPAIGCGEGGLRWSDVHGMLHRYFADSRFVVEIYHPR